MAEDRDTSGQPANGLRHARMKIETVVLVSRGTDSFPTELEDISATGVMLHRPRDWPGKVDEIWILDMIFGRDLHIHVEASVMRVSADWVGLAYTRIPEDKQAALWNLLGGYADKLEQWKDD